MDFNAIITSIVDVIKGINWDEVIATVKSIAEKVIPVVEELIGAIAEKVG